MPQISRTTNPTGLKKLNVKLFAVRVQTVNAERSFWLEKFDHKLSQLPAGLQLSCIAHCGNSEEFFKLGTVDAPDLSAKPLRNLATNKPLKFRFVVHLPSDPKLVAFADGVRAIDDAGVLGGSLVDIELADLMGSAWKLEIPPLVAGLEKPVLLVNKKMFASVQAAANNSWIAVLVMPEVFRQIATVIAENPDCLDDQEIWAFSWAQFFLGFGGHELPEGADREAKNEWIESVVVGFCAKPSMRTQMANAVIELNGGVL